MPKKILLFVFLAFCFNGLAHSESHVSNSDTLNGGYYSYVNQAELAVVDSNYISADSLYRRAFSVAKRPFGQDFLLAAVNASKLNADSLVFQYLEESVSHGVQLRQIEKNQQLKEYFTAKGFNISKNAVLPYKRLRSEYLGGLDLKLRRKIKRLTFRDQMVRTIPGFFSLFSFTIDRKNFNQVYEICITTGKIPGFTEIGENIQSKTDLTDLTLLLRHFNLYEIRVLEPYILKAIDEGAIYPWGYASAVDYGAYKSMAVLDRQKDTVTFEFQFIYGVLSPYFLGTDYAEGNTDEFNHNRNLIGLESIEDQLYKSGKTVSDFTNYPATKRIKSHRKDLRRIWKKGKPWKKE